MLEEGDLEAERNPGERDDVPAEHAHEEGSDGAANQDESGEGDARDAELVPAHVAHEGPVVGELREAVRAPLAAAGPRRRREPDHRGRV